MPFDGAYQASVQDALAQNGSCMDSERIQVLVQGCCWQPVVVVERGDGQDQARKGYSHHHMRDMAEQVGDGVLRRALSSALSDHLALVRTHHSEQVTAIGSRDASVLLGTQTDDCPAWEELVLAAYDLSDVAHDLGFSSW